MTDRQKKRRGLSAAVQNGCASLRQMKPIPTARERRRIADDMDENAADIEWEQTP